MELAVAAATKLFSSIGLSGAASGAGGAAAGLSGAQVFATALGLLGQIGSGMAAKAQADQMAAQAEIEAGQEKVQSTQRQTAMKRSLVQILGENDTTFAAAGIDISGGGIAQSAAADAKKRAASEISIDREDADMRRALHRMRASGYRAQGRSALGGALLGALNTGVKTAFNISAVG